MSIRTLIWGSCVSRDTFEFLPHDFALVHYIARQSWISAGCPAVQDYGSIESSFQKRITEADLLGDAWTVVKDRSSSTDLVLLDFCDERLGVVEFSDGAVVTRSVEKISNASQLRMDQEGQVVQFGSQYHFSRWQNAVSQGAEKLRSLNLFDKCLVLAPAWAVIDDNAESVPRSFGAVTSSMNEIFERYHKELEEQGFTVGRVAPTMGDSVHRWGRAPFHYDRRTYESIAQIITTFVA